MLKFIRLHWPFIFIFLLVVLAVAGYFYNNNVSYNNPTASQNEVQKLSEEVGQLFVLPTNEVPTVATVSDPAALKGQPFFVDAKRGDKVLIYTNAKKAILYDPVIKKIINVAPVNTGDFPKSAPLSPNANSNTLSPGKSEF